MIRTLFENTVSAICYSLAGDQFECGDEALDARPNAAVRFTLAQHAAAPLWLSLPLILLTVVFSLQCLVTGGRLFHQESRARRRAQLDAWQTSRLGLRRDLVRFYQSLAVLPCLSQTCGD